MVSRSKVAFRDEDEALRQQIGVLRREIDALAREQSDLEEERRALASTIEEQANAHVSSPRIIWIMGAAAMVALVGVLAFGLSASAGGSNSDVLYGRVVAATGAAPVAMGARCTTFVEPASGKNQDYEARLAVLCDGRVVYGGGTAGYARCDEGSGLRWTCYDVDFSDEGGDPKLRFERRTRQIWVAEREWRIRIELTTPPRGTR